MVRIRQSGLLEAREDGTLVRRIHPSADLDTMSNEGWRCGPVRIASGSSIRSEPNHWSATGGVHHVQPSFEGDHRQAYFEEKRRVFPPEVERVAGRTYPSGPFNIGNPIDG